MENKLFCDWIKYSVLEHKKHINPDGKSLLLVDNHVSRFSVAAIHLCTENNLEVLCYPGHLTLAFISIINHAVETVCTIETVKKAFSATGEVPFNPEKIDISKYPSSSSGFNTVIESPIQATCTECHKTNVELHPLVKQGLIPKKIAEALQVENSKDCTDRHF